MSPTPARDQAQESLLTVVIAFAANLLVATAKTAAALVTGSASLVAEAAHSWVDTANQVFLLVAERRSQRPRDVRHPQGYGKEAYVWSMIAAFGLFTAGAVLSVQHGIQELLAPEPASDYPVAYVVLAVSAVIEGVSFVRAYQQARRLARERNTGTLEHVIATSNPTLRAVFAEDSAAMVGLVLAFLGVLLHQLTGSPLFDALGSILIGVMLGVVAIILIDRNRRFLVGQSIDEATRQLIIEQLLLRPDIDRVTYLHMEYVGPDRLFVVAAVDLAGNEPEDRLALCLRRLELDIERHPNVAEAVLTLSAPGGEDPRTAR
ncbi:cation diffusion facilitator family transporter [Micromonospora sp. NPDC050417]|uniref:cation diffusion facilitator family transporter n=1 Tax=Micromonospora sp. NPDC050417 TaxID=3364280 RepID=UPI0037915003